MAEITHIDFSLARRLEAAEAAFGAELAADHLWIAGGCAASLGPDSPLTHALGLGMNGPVTTADFDRLENFYHERGVTPNINLCPLADVSMVELLGARGYRPLEFNNVLVRRISREDGGGPLMTPIEDCEKWALTLARCFYGEENIPEELMVVGRTLFRARSASSFLIDDMAGCALMLQSGLATFYADGTRAMARGRGLQSETIRARIALSASQECDLATASTLPGSQSQRNYERAGFRVAYTKIAFEKSNAAPARSPSNA
jgi:hypothetical protein